MNTRILICAAAIVAALAACKPREEETGKVSDTGRKETRSIEAVDDVGYAGSAVRKKVDKALDTNDNRVDQLDDQIDSQD